MKLAILDVNEMQYQQVQPVWKLYGTQISVVSKAIRLCTNFILKNSDSMFWCPNQFNSTKIRLGTTLVRLSQLKTI